MLKMKKTIKLQTDNVTNKKLSIALSYQASSISSVSMELRVTLIAFLLKKNIVYFPV